jgi:hypothetical protein
MMRAGGDITNPPIIFGWSAQVVVQEYANLTAPAT